MIDEKNNQENSKVRGSDNNVEDDKNNLTENEDIHSRFLENFLEKEGDFFFNPNSKKEIDNQSEADFGSDYSATRSKDQLNDFEVDAEKSFLEKLFAGFTFQKLLQKILSITIKLFSSLSADDSVVGKFLKKFKLKNIFLKILLLIRLRLLLRLAQALLLLKKKYKTKDRYYTGSHEEKEKYREDKSEFRDKEKEKSEEYSEHRSHKKHSEKDHSEKHGDHDFRNHYAGHSFHAEHKNHPSNHSFAHSIYDNHTSAHIHHEPHPIHHENHGHDFHVHPHHHHKHREHNVDARGIIKAFIDKVREVGEKVLDYTLGLSRDFVKSVGEGVVKPIFNGYPEPTKARSYPNTPGYINPNQQNYGGPSYGNQPQSENYDKQRDYSDGSVFPPNFRDLTAKLPDIELNITKIEFSRNNIEVKQTTFNFRK